VLEEEFLCDAAMPDKLRGMKEALAGDGVDVVQYAEQLK
jgi:hypothetical protein